MPTLRMKPVARPVVFAVLLASCGPAGPAGPGSESTTETGAAEGGVGSSSGGPATPTGTDAATGTATTGDETGPTVTGSTSTGEALTGSSTGPGDGGVCVADPASGTCTESCDWWKDCCQCDGKRISPDDELSCTVAMGIVVDECPWDVWAVFWDGEAIDGWAQDVQGGDIVVEFIGDACTALLAGEFTEIEIGMFCEAA